MIAFDQRVKHIPGVQSGDCMRACLASVFEVDPEDVPHFADIAGPMAWWEGIRQFARDQGFDVIVVGDLTEVDNWGAFPYPLASVPSPRGDWYHLVVCDTDGVVVHDPFPAHTLNGEKADAFEWWVVCEPYKFPDEYVGAAA